MVGGVAGGITLEGVDYLDGANVMSTQFLTAADVTAKPVEDCDVEVIFVEDVIRVVYSGEGCDGVEQLTTLNPQSSTLYDLTGRRVEKATKGIYIVGGKKVLF